jgi:cytochrome P450
LGAAPQASPSAGDRVRFAVGRGAVRAAVGVRGLLGDPAAALFTRRGRADPYPHYREIRRRGRLVPGATGLASASHALVDEVLRSPAFGSARPSQGRAGDWLSSAALLDPVQAVATMSAVPSPLGPRSLIGSDPPDHTRLRRLVSRAFTPRAVAAWRPRIEQIADALRDARLDRAAATGDGVIDVIPAFAAPLPVLVICELLGVPAADRRRFQHWGDALARTLDLLTLTTARQAAVALDELAAYFDVLFERRRREPGDDVIDVLLAAEADEPGLSSDELLATTLLLLAAGFETTVNLIGNAVLALLQHPAQLALLRAEPARTAAAVEEALRWDAPVQRDVRFARVDVDLDGRTVPAGTPVGLLLAGANRDPEVFADPERFDLTRRDAHRHLAFASGIHHCLGAALARLEGEIAISVLLRRAPALASAGPMRRRAGMVLRGVTSLPVRTGA